MAAVSGIWNHAASASTASPLSGVHAMDDTSSGSSTSSSSSDDGATITANDFLTLLVTEMQNQDPTADTDPNEYINQLVNVNSLEQLININQTLTTAIGGSPTSNGDSVQAASGVNAASAAQNTVSTAHPQNAVSQAASADLSNPSTSSSSTPGSTLANTTSGNLGISSAQPSAMRIAQSLSSPRATR